MINHELFRAIAEQSKTTFPDSSYKDHLTKAAGEVEEALKEPKPKRLVEYADILHCVIAAAAEDGFTAEDLDAAGWYKLAVNKVRRWERLADGTYQHISDREASADPK